MQKNRFCELKIISRFDLRRNCLSKSPFLPRFPIFRPWFLPQECGANLKNGWLRLHKHSTWDYFPSDAEILNIKSVFMQNSCVKPKRLVNLHHVVKYRAIYSSVRLFARTAHSFACSALLTLLARSAALIRSLARSLTHSGAHGLVINVYELNASISYSFSPLCIARNVSR